MVISTFFVSDKENKESFFEESFLFADVKPDIVSGMLCLTMRNVDNDFQDRNLQWMSYTTGDIFPTTKQVELIGKKEFAVAVLDLEYETFIVHVAVFCLDIVDKMHPLKKTQIAYLKADEAFTKVLSKYADFTNVFSLKLVVELFEYIKMSDHAIK